MLWSKPFSFIWFLVYWNTLTKSNFSDGVIYKSGKEIIGKMLQNRIVRNYSLEEQFFSESVLFLKTPLVAASKITFESFTWNVSVFVCKNFWKSSWLVKHKSVRIPLYAPLCGWCRSNSLVHILFFLCFCFLLGFWGSSKYIITATKAQNEAVNRSRSVLFMLLKHHNKVFLYNYKHGQNIWKKL